MPKEELEGQEPQNTDLHPVTAAAAALDTLAEESEEEEGPTAEPVEDTEDTEEEAEDVYEIDGKQVSATEMADVYRRSKAIQADSTKKWTEAQAMKQAAERLQTLARQQQSVQSVQTAPPKLGKLPNPLDDEEGYARGVAEYAAQVARHSQSGAITPEQIQEMVQRAIAPIKARESFDAVEAQFKLAHPDLTSDDIEAVIQSAADAVDQGLIRPDMMKDASGKLTTDFLEDALAIHQRRTGHREKELAAAVKKGGKKVLRQLNSGVKRVLRPSAGGAPTPGMTKTQIANMSARDLAKIPEAELDAMWLAARE